MRTLKKHISNKIKNKNFKKLYNEEKKLLELSLKIHEIREKNGLSQSDLARSAKITQQQLSKIENGVNCNILTFLKVCNALEIDINFILKKRNVLKNL